MQASNIVVLDKGDKGAVVTDMTVPNNSNIKKKEQEKLEKRQDQRAAGEHVGTKNSGPCLIDFTPQPPWQLWTALLNINV